MRTSCRRCRERSAAPPSPASPSPPRQPRHGGHELFHLLVAASLLDALAHAVPNVSVQQPDTDSPQGGIDGVQLRQDVDAILVLVDHPLQAANLSLDSTETVLQVLLVHRVAVHETPF